MEIKENRKRLKTQEHYENRRLQLYTLPPTQDISLEEFNDLALKRQKVLQEVHNMREKLVRGDLDTNDYNSQMREKTKLLPLTHVKANETLTMRHIEERRRDHISHYILRLAHCKTEEQRRWFLSQEVELLRYRLTTANQHEYEDLIRFYKKYLPLEKVSVPKIEYELEQDSELDTEQECVSKDVHSYYIMGDSTSCYRVYFTQVLDLVQRKSVVVKNGYAYFPVEDTHMIISLLCNKFRTLLSQDLVRTVAHMGVVEEDERISPLLKNIKEAYYGKDFSDISSQLGEKITLTKINSLSQESFPPCMRYLHDTLRQDHHLRHFGRLQYGLFLKSIGLSLEQALAFWRDEFTKKMDMEKFDKQYAYNVRHSYGKEGKRANYTAYSCMKIITTNAPTTGDHHGCPFRHWDDTHLQEKLLRYGVPFKSVSKVMDYAHSSHYQLACQKYFDIVHGLPQTTFSLEHPSQYFYESRRVRGGLMSETTVKTEEHTEADIEADIIAEFSDLSEQALAEITADNDMEIN